MAAYVHDITERRRAQERQAYHASLLNHVDDGVIATDAEDFRITAWNRGAERLYGYSAAEVLGRPARDGKVFSLLPNANTPPCGGVLFLWWIRAGHCIERVGE